MIVTVRELIKELIQFPADWEVWMEVRGEERPVKGISMEAGGISAWILLTDFPDKSEGGDKS